MNEFIKINIYEKIENRKTFFLPYFHRSLDDYKKTFEKYFKNTKIIELKPDKKIMKDKILPFYSFEDNLYYPEITEIPSSVYFVGKRK